MATNEFEHGFELLANQFKMYKFLLGNGKAFHFKVESSGGWFTHFHATKGLFVSSMWFTPDKTLTYTMDIDKPCMLILGMDCGDIMLTQKGKVIKHLTSNNHILINPQKPVKITFPVNIHTCCTCILVFEEFFQNFLTGRTIDKPFNIADAKSWDEAVYNTPDVTLVLDQIKWAARSGVVPLFHYECKVGELLSIILKNIDYYRLLNKDRRYHITWENEQKIKRIKTLIDKDILRVPGVETLAMSEAISVSKLHRCFKQYFRITLLEYVHVEKMKRALLLLAADELSIKNIAHLCGYESASKFTSAFKAVHNITPSQYRKANSL